jgi:hypothetical protein
MKWNSATIICTDKSKYPRLVKYCIWNGRHGSSKQAALPKNQEIKQIFSAKLASRMVPAPVDTA